MKSALLLVTFSALLQAAAVITITPGPLTSRTGTSTINFDSLGFSTKSPFSDGVATYQWMGQSPFFSGTLVNNYIAPLGDGTVYLGVGAPGYADLIQITFSVPIRYFGFYYGTPDSYNWMTAYAIDDLAGPSMGWTGPMILPQGTLGAYVNFDFTTPVNKIIMASSSAAFESDNHSYSSAGLQQSLPEPQSFLMVGLGLSALLAILRFRRLRQEPNPLNPLAD